MLAHHTQKAQLLSNWLPDIVVHGRCYTLAVNKGVEALHLAVDLLPFIPAASHA
jgi:hypothetical protein